MYHPFIFIMEKEAVLESLKYIYFESDVLLSIADLLSVNTVFYAFHCASVIIKITAH